MLISYPLSITISLPSEGKKTKRKPRSKKKERRAKCKKRRVNEISRKVVIAEETLGVDDNEVGSE